MNKKRGLFREILSDRILKSIRKIFAFGYFSLSSLFFLLIILLLTLLSKTLYDFIVLRGSIFLVWACMVIFFIAGFFILLIFLETNLECYEFNKESDYHKTSEFDKKIKEKDYIRKKGFLKGTYLEKRLGNFLLFSFYQGVIIMQRPFWLVKSLFSVFKNVEKNKKEGFRSIYGWRKLYDEIQKEFIYYPFVMNLYKD